jgi:hypothetical protein
LKHSRKKRDTKHATAPSPIDSTIVLKFEKIVRTNPSFSEEIMKFLLPNNALMLTFLSIIIFQFFLNAETIHLSGTVLNETNYPIEGAEIYLYSRTAIRTFSDKNGVFDLSCTIGIKSAQITTRMSNLLVLKRNVLTAYMKPQLPATIEIYSINGKLFFEKSIIPNRNGEVSVNTSDLHLSSGIFVLIIRQFDDTMRATCAIPGNEVRTARPTSKPYSPSHSLSSGIAPDFHDILVITATGTQTVRRAVTAPIEDNIKIKLMPLGVGYVTPGIPVYTDKGGIGDITTYGSVSNPEYSQGGACNYGMTRIRYYAGINANQIPGDKKGQWQGGQICGRCARVRIRTASGEERTTVVRIMDKCPDDNCGIDLGGAPAAMIMQTQPGRYSGEWEWVTCENSDSISDGAPSLYVKTGSNEYWSLVQARNGPGSVAEMRIRKAGTESWQILNWATEAENFFRLPVELIQDSTDWEIGVEWSTGMKSSLQIAGKKLAIEDTLYNLD